MAGPYRFQTHNLPLLVIRNFNTARFKVRGERLFFNQLKHFNDCLSSCGLIDLRNVGGLWT